MIIDFWFFIGVLIYLIIFIPIYFYSKKRGKENSQLDLEQRDKITRWTLAALIFSLCWLVFRPIWFPGENVKYDFFRILLIFTTIVAIITTYIKYAKKSWF